MTRSNTPPPPTARPIKASELGAFAFCQRAWFLEDRGEPTTLTEERARGAADHAARVVSIARGQRHVRCARLLWVLGLLALLCGVIWAGLHR